MIADKLHRQVYNRLLIEILASLQPIKSIDDYRIIRLDDALKEQYVSS
jgi:hypothetical protein